VIFHPVSCSELFIVDAVQWHKIRAAQMLIAMRAISLGFQLDDKSISSLPEPLAYFGYLFHVGTVAFGPWVPYKDYANMENNRKSVQLLHSSSFQNLKLIILFFQHLKWIFHVARSIVFSLAFLMFSACWVIWLIPAGNPK
jgi:O-palmitoleoyl transferase